MGIIGVIFGLLGLISIGDVEGVEESKGGGVAGQSLDAHAKRTAVVES